MNNALCICSIPDHMATDSDTNVQCTWNSFIAHLLLCFVCLSMEQERQGDEGEGDGGGGGAVGTCIQHTLLLARISSWNYSLCLPHLLGGGGEGKEFIEVCEFVKSAFAALASASIQFDVSSPKNPVKLYRIDKCGALAITWASYIELISSLPSISM